MPKGIDFLYRMCYTERIESQPTQERKMKTELIKTEWYIGQLGKIQMATLHKVTDGSDIYYIVNGDVYNLIVDYDLVNSVFLSILN